MIKMKKGFLTTASLLAITTGLNTSAFAALVESDGNGAILLQDGAIPSNTTSGVPWGQHDSLALHSSDPIQSGGVGATISVLDIYGNNSAFQISANSSVSSVVNSFRGSAANLQVNIDDNVNFIIGGHDGLKHGGTVQAAGIFTALGDVTLGSGVHGGNLIIDNNVNLPGFIDSYKNHTGTISVQDGKRAIFEESIGSKNIIKQLSILGDNSRAILKKDSGIDTIELRHGNAKLILDDDARLIGKIESNGNGGKLILRGNNEITGTIGFNNGLSCINVNGQSVGGNVSVFYDIVETNRLDINHNNTLISKTNSIANANRISISNDGKLIIDTDGNYNLNNGRGIKFDGRDSTLELTNTSAIPSVITLKNHLSPGAALDTNGILELNATGESISLNHGTNKTIGIDNTHRLNNFIISGNQNIVLDTDTFVKTISIDSTGDVTFNKNIESGKGSIMQFSNSGNSIFNGNVSVEEIDLGNGIRDLTLNNSLINTKSIISTVGQASLSLVGNSNLNLANGGAVAVNAIFAGSVGATATLGRGQYNVDDIQIIDASGEIEIGDETIITGGFNINGGAPGKINFMGNADVMEDLGSITSPVGPVTVSGDNKVLILGNNVNVGSLNASNIDDQYLKFNNHSDVSVRGDIGNNHPFKKISFSGPGVLTFEAGALHANQDLSFENSNHVISENYDLGNANIENITNNNKLTVNIDQNISGNIGDVGNFFGELHVDAPTDKNITINSNQFFAGITGKNANVILNKDGVSVAYLGKDMSPIKYVNFLDNGEILGAVNVDNIDVQNDKTATFNHDVFNAELQMVGATSVAEFNNNVTISSPIKGKGIVHFRDGAAINNELGTVVQRLSQVHFNGDTTVGSNIHSDEIFFNNNSLTIDNMAEFDGRTAFNNTNITLNNDLVMKNGNVELIGAVVINTPFDGAKVNSITASDGSIIKLSSTDTLQINIDDSVNNVVGGTVIKPLKVDATGKLDIDMSKLTVSSTSSKSNWVASIKGDGLLLTHISETSNATPASKAIIPTDNEAKENIPSSGKNIFVPSNEALKSLGKKVTSASSRANNAFMDATGRVERSILDRTIGHQANRAVSVASIDGSDVTGISSGDSPDKYGMWGSTYYSNNVKKERTGNAGYISNSFGGTLGFDTKISEDSLVGFALSVTNTNIKHKDVNAGDKTDIISYLLSAYTNQVFSNNWFGQGILSIGSSNVKHKDSRSIGTSKQIATSDYNSMIFSTEAILGYNSTFSNKSTITPMFGISYYGISSQEYKETGAANMQLLSIGKMKSHKLDAIAGVKFTSQSMNAGSLMITPEVHAFINHDLIGKNQNIEAQLNGTSIQTQKVKSQRTFYNLGGSLNIAHGSTDYSLAVDTNLAPKYTGVQGSLKMRINF